MQIINIDSVEIFLQDYHFGSGKIIISDSYGFNFSYKWDSMNSNLKDFILGISSDYFVKCLIDIDDRGVFDSKTTVSEVRKFIKSDCYELPWYKHLEFQKSLRFELNNIQKYCTSEYEFVDMMYAVPSKLDFSSVEEYDRSSVESEIESLFKCEPWNFISKKDSPKTIFLKNIFIKLQKKLKK